MTKYRVDQVIYGKTYQGGKLYTFKKQAQEVAAAQEAADKVTGDCQISYIIVEVK